MPTVEYVHFKSKDGTTVAGYLYKPPDYQPGVKYPTILKPHGGPVWAYYAEFQFRSAVVCGERVRGADAESTRIVGIRHGLLQGDFRGLGPQGF